MTRISVFDVFLLEGFCMGNIIFYVIIKLIEVYIV